MLHSAFLSNRGRIWNGLQWLQVYYNPKGRNEPSRFTGSLESTSCVKKRPEHWKEVSLTLIFYEPISIMCDFRIILKYCSISPSNSPEAIVEGFLSRHNTNISSTLDPDSVSRQQILYFIQTLSKFAGKLINVIQQSKWQILHNSKRQNDKTQNWTTNSV